MPTKTQKPPKSAEIKTWEEACQVKGIDPIKSLPEVSMLPAAHQKALVAFAKLAIIADVINEGWKPDWDNGEWKYWPWFYMDEPGFRFAYYDGNCDFSAVGSRLCYKTRTKAEYAAKTFLDLYRDMMVLG